MDTASTLRRVARRELSFILLVLFSFVITACGGGGGGGGNTTPTPTPPATTSLSGGGVKGPLANATVTVYALDTSAADFKGAVIGSGTTNAAAQIVGLSIPASATPPFIMEFTSTASTTDITTNAAPVIGTLRTVLTQQMIASGEPVYASPLTTMATDIAIANADSNVTPYSGDNNGVTSTSEFLNALPIAAAQVVSTVGFGASGIDIWTTPPLINAATTSATQQTDVAQYRTRSASRPRTAPSRLSSTATAPSRPARAGSSPRSPTTRPGSRCTPCKARATWRATTRAWPSSSSPTSRRRPRACPRSRSPSRSTSTGSSR